jgi:hypothetical protein
MIFRARILLERGLIIMGSMAIGSMMTFAQVKMPPSMEECIKEPVKYSGSVQPKKDLHDGRLPHAAGAQHYQVFRANRQEPVEDHKVGRTYNHQPYLAYWNGRFYLQFLSAEYQEHTPPACVFLTTSVDGKNWTFPEILFPDYELPEIKGEDYTIPAGTMAVMHQRMGFYVTSGGKLLASGFYGYCATPRHSPNAGNGLGRVIREVKEDGSYGPVYFIRYNRHAGWDEHNTSFPYYKESKDSEFVKACEELLDNKLVSLQWWEEDRGKDGFYVIDPADVSGATYFDANMVTSKGAGKALSSYHRPDGVVVGLWKNQFAALSDDEGKSWTPIGKCLTLRTTGAKTWGQRTEDGRYVIVHNHSATGRNRFPMTALVGDDGHDFYDILCLNGEVAPQRYHGIHRNVGTQYFRGISEGNGDPPGTHAWFVYSMNKEDIWITRARTPLSGVVDEHVDQDFDAISTVAELEMWNLYIPRWAPIDLVYRKEGGKALRIKDEEPYDYAFAERVLPSSEKITIEFSYNLQQAPRGFYAEFEAQDQRGNRPLKLRFDDAWMSMDVVIGEITDPVAIETGRWYDVRLEIDCLANKYDLYLDGSKVRSDVPFYEDVDAIERMLFRTGYYRLNVDSRYMEKGMMNPSSFDSEDKPGSETKRHECTILIDNVKTKSQ